MHKWAYRRAYKKAVKANPHLAEYILCDADCPALLKGIVKEEDCEHPSAWHGLREGVDWWRCAVCMKEQDKPFKEKDESSN